MPQHLMMRVETPLSLNWVAKLCRSVCTPARLVNPATLVAERQAAIAGTAADSVLPVPADMEAFAWTTVD
nr:hypothetical protein [Ensifer aridi]